MKVFAKFTGNDWSHTIKTGTVYLIRIYPSDGELEEINVRISDSFWCPYSNYNTFKDNWEIV